MQNNCYIQAYFVHSPSYCLKITDQNMTASKFIFFTTLQLWKTKKKQNLSPQAPQNQRAKNSFGITKWTTTAFVYIPYEFILHGFYPASEDHR